jgi:hypothetical protein
MLCLTEVKEYYILCQKIFLRQSQADTRKKIQWGGLVKKAGLENETTAVLLGLLLDARENLLSTEGEEVRKAWRLKGDVALTQASQ